MNVNATAQARFQGPFKVNKEPVDPNEKFIMAAADEIWNLKRCEKSEIVAIVKTAVKKALNKADRDWVRALARRRRKGLR